MLMKLGVVDQRTKAVYEVLDGADVTEVALRTASAVRRCTRGSRSTPTRASRRSSTKAPGLRPAPTRCRRRWRPASSSYAVPIPAGDRARSSTG